MGHEVTNNRNRLMIFRHQNPFIGVLVQKKQGNQEVIDFQKAYEVAATLSEFYEMDVVVADTTQI